MPKMRQIHLPEELCQALESRFARPDLADAQAILLFVATELLRDDARSLDQKEREVLEQRLLELGYL